MNRAALGRMALICAAVVGCQDAPPPDFKPGPFPQMSACRLAPDAAAGRIEAITAIARTKVAAHMRDPESVRFTRASIYALAKCNEGDHEIVCGFVNAKNAYGGYVGESPFAFITWGAEYSIATYRKDDIRELTALVDATKLCGEMQDRSPK